MNAQFPRLKRKPSTSGERPLPVDQSLRRRTFKYAAFLALVVILLFTFSSPSREVVTDLTLFHHTPVHKPPPQKNSTSGDIHWYSDWKWLNPFSSSITLDDDRSVLPPLEYRPPIYTFYDANAEKDEKIKAAENKLLLIWRRAWWAQGFRPVVLGRSEALNNPQYEQLQSKKLSPQLETEFLRWLAWEQMGTGTLANWLCLPMGARDQPLFKFLRRAEYPKLIRFQGLENGLYAGEKDSINQAIKEALESPKIKEAKDFVSLITIKEEKQPDTLAFYSATTIAKSYKEISTKLSENKADGLANLAELILSHLHQSFLSRFPDGIAVPIPEPRKSYLLTHTAYSLASALRNCPTSPIPSSCPPNLPSCKPCTPETAPPILMPLFLLNSSSIFTIGTCPHPYTFASLLSKTKELTTRHIRRDTKRDRWLISITEETQGKVLGGPSRLVGFKDGVAGDVGAAHSFWVVNGTVPHRKDMEYHFGFPLPTFDVTEASLPPAPHGAVDHEPSKKEKKGRETELQLQKELIAAAREVVQHKRKKKEKTGAKEMVEAWNLADTEAWRFVRAFRARERIVREKWEQEERRFAGGEEGEGGWRWFDRRMD